MGGAESEDEEEPLEERRCEREYGERFRGRGWWVGRESNEGVGGSVWARGVVGLADRGG